MRSFLALLGCVICLYANGQSAQANYDACISRASEQQDAATKELQERYKEAGSGMAVLGCNDCPPSQYDIELGQISRNYEIQSKLCLLDYNTALAAEERRQQAEQEQKENQRQNELSKQSNNNGTSSNIADIDSKSYSIKINDVVCTIKLSSKSIKNYKEHYYGLNVIEGVLTENTKLPQRGTKCSFVAKKGTVIIFTDQVDSKPENKEGVIIECVISESARLENYYLDAGAYPHPKNFLFQANSKIGFEVQHCTYCKPEDSDAYTLRCTDGSPQFYWAAVNPNANFWFKDGMQWWNNRK